MTHPLFVDSEYRTAPRKTGWLAKRFPSFVFYSRMTQIVWRASRRARQGLYDDNQWVGSSLEVLQALEQVGVEFEVTGINYLEQFDSPCLVVGNHMSTLETTILPAIIQPRHRVTFVVKQSLLDYPVFKHVMRSRDPIAVSQKDPRGDFKAMMQGGVDRLAKGISLIVFPEGERATSFDPAGFNSIGVKLARKANVPIVPLALETSAWGMGRWISDVGKIDPSRRVRFAFGEPIEVESRGNVEQEQIVQFIRRKLTAWGEF